MPIWDDGRLLDGPEADRHIVDGNATGCRFIQEPDSFWSLQHDIERASISVASPSGLGGVLRWVAIMPRIAPPNYTQIPNAILDVSAEFSPAQFKVLIEVARQTFGWGRTWSHGGFSSVRRIACRTGLSPTTVHKELGALLDAGWISRRKFGPGVSRPWSYRIKVYHSLVQGVPLSGTHKRNEVKKQGAGADRRYPGADELSPMPPDWPEWREPTDD